MSEYENPFESTSNEAAYVEPEAEIVPPRPLSRVITYWAIVCPVCAIPSFMLGTSVVQPPWGVVGMVLGVLLFVVAYVVVDRRYLEPLAMRNGNFRSAMRWGLGLRATASLIVPAGVILDMLPGMLSIGIVQAIFPVSTGLSYADSSQPGSPMGADFGFIPALLTTLLQGLFMNALLWPVILALYAALDFFRGKKVPASLSP